MEVLIVHRQTLNVRMPAPERRGGVGLVHITKGNLERIKIPLPPLATRQTIVAEIEAEQALVTANRELIKRMEKKVQTTLARIWGEEAEAAEPVILP